MKKEPNNPSVAPSEAGHWGGLFRVAIVGAATLKGRELKEVLSDRNFPAQDVRLLDDDESLGQLEAVGDEPTFIQSVLPEHLENVDFTFFASEENFTREIAPLARKAAARLPALAMTSLGLRGSVGIPAMPFCRSMTTNAVFVGSNSSFAMALLSLYRVMLGHLKK